MVQFHSMLNAGYYFRCTRSATYCLYGERAERSCEKIAGRYNSFESLMIYLCSRVKASNALRCDVSVVSIIMYKIKRLL